MAIDETIDRAAEEHRLTLSRRDGLIAGLILLAAVALRLAAASNDLWLDEVWSLELAGSVGSPLDVITQLHHDNNHYLNTLWMRAVGQHAQPLTYRLLAIVAGAATVVVAGVIGARRDRATGWLALLMFSLSYVMVLYSSEARGYATLCLCALVAYDSLEQFFARPRWTMSALYFVSGSLGMLSHPIFVAVLAAALLSALDWILRPYLVAYLAARRAPSSAGDHPATAGDLRTHKLCPRTIAMLAIGQTGPLMVLVLLYFLDVRQIKIGGGAISKSLGTDFAWALSWAFGLPLSGLPAQLAVVLGLIAGCAGLWTLWQSSQRQTLFFVCVIVTPLALAVLRGASVIYARYFLVSIVFFLLATSFWLGALWNSGARAKRAAAVAILAVFCVANGIHLATLLRHGRGDARDAIRLIASQSHGPTEVGSDNSFRVNFTGEYVARTQVPDDRIAFVNKNLYSSDPPDWYIAHKESYETPVPFSADLTGRNGVRYKLVATFPTAPLSGLHWFVYRRQ